MHTDISASVRMHTHSNRPIMQRYGDCVCSPHTKQISTYDQIENVQLQNPI